MKRFVGNTIGALCVTATVIWLFRIEPTPKNQCESFSGVVTGIHTGRRARFKGAVIRTAAGERVIRSNNGTINFHLRNAIGDRVHGLLESERNVVELAVNDVEIMSYAEFRAADHRSNVILASVFAVASLVFWCDAIRLGLSLWRRSKGTPEQIAR